MNRNIITFVILLCLVLFITGEKINPPPHIEKYSTEVFDRIKYGKDNHLQNQLAHGQRSTDCYDLNQRDCMKYNNCGLCKKYNRISCIPGDMHGPYFKSGCDKWQYTNYYDGFPFGDRFTTITRPWDTFYPDYELRLADPISRATL